MEECLALAQLPRPNNAMHKRALLQRSIAHGTLGVHGLRALLLVEEERGLARVSRTLLRMGVYHALGASSSLRLATSKLALLIAHGTLGPRGHPALFLAYLEAHSLAIELKTQLKLEARLALEALSRSLLATSMSFVQSTALGTDGLSSPRALLSVEEAFQRERELRTQLRALEPLVADQALKQYLVILSLVCLAAPGQRLLQPPHLHPFLP